MNLQGILGIILIPAIAFLFSKNKKNIEWSIVIWGISMQLFIAALILGTPLFSITAMAVIALCLVVYNLEASRLCPTSSLIKIICSILILGLGTTVISFMGESSLMLRNTVWALFLIIGSCRVIGKEKFSFLPNYWVNIGGILVAVSILGAMIGTKTTGSDLFTEISDGFNNFLKFAAAGGNFTLGPIYDGKIGSVFAIKIGVTTIFFSAIISFLDSLGIINSTIGSVSRFVNWSMKTFVKKPISGVEMVTSIAGIPTGTSAIMIVKSYLDKLTESEILLLMTSVMATISGTVFGAFISMGISPTHLLGASAMSIPAAICLAKIFLPEEEDPLTSGQEITLIPGNPNPLGAITDGINSGLQVALIVGASLIAFISMIAVVNAGLLKADAFIDGHLLVSIFNGEQNIYGEFKGIIPGSLRTFFGVLFAPLAFSMGVPANEILSVGYLMGTKISINEFVAYSQLGEFINNGSLSQQSIIISSFALCGFANPGTLALLLGTVNPFIDKTKNIWLKHGINSVFLGAGASWMTAAVASLFTGLL